MNVRSKVENKEQFSVELVIEVGPEEFEAGVEQAYRKNRGSISVPGFRKGKAPRKVIEGMYGSGTFYQEAIEELYPAACEEAIAAEKLDIVASPSIEIEEAGKESGLVFKAVFTVRPVIEISDYKGIKAQKVMPAITDEMVDNELKTYIDRASHTESVERPAILTDTTIIDFEGFKEGIPFQGGKGEDFELVLGSGSFIPGFEDQVVGMSPGEEKEIDVTFPENYQMEDLAGKPAKFRVKVKEIKAKVLPELDDEFAKDVSEFETLEAFKADLRAKVTDRVETQVSERFRQNVLDKLAEKVTITLPEAMVESQVDRNLEDFTNRIQNQGIPIDMYYQYMQSNETLVRQELRAGAENQIRIQLALEAVARAEDIQISEEEITAEYERLSGGIQISVEELEKVITRDTFRLDMQRERAMSLVIDSADAQTITEEELKLEEVKAEEKAEEPKEEKPKKKAAPRKPRKKATEEGEAEAAPAAPAAPKKKSAAATKKVKEAAKEEKEAAKAEKE